MADYLDADLKGSRFERVDLSGSEFRATDLTGSQFRNVSMSRVVMRGVELVDLDMYGEIVNMTVNGVDIGPLIDAELNRRYPDRAKMRPADPAGFREAAVGPDRSASPPPATRAAAGVGRRRVVVHRDAAPPGVRHRLVDQAGDPR